MRNVFLLVALSAGVALAQPGAANQFLLKIEPVRTGFTLQNMTAEEGRLAGEHLQYLMTLADFGKLSLAAQVFDPKGLWGLVIVNAPDREAAAAVLENDPMVKGKTFRGEVLPVRVVLEKPAGAAKPAVTVDAKILESYAGTYKSDQIALEIQATVKDGRLFLQASGQPEIPLKAVSATQFEFAPGGIAIEFDSAGSFTLKQRGMNSVFKKAPAK